MSVDMTDQVAEFNKLHFGKLLCRQCCIAFLFPVFGEQLYEHGSPKPEFQNS
jgi:hypothetical protein